MSNYNNRNRQIGQTDDEGLALEYFYGPVELWRRQDGGRFSVYMYLVADTDFDISAKKTFNVKRYSTERAREEIEELFRAACEVVSHLPEGHPLNSLLCPYQPPS